MSFNSGAWQNCTRRIWLWRQGIKQFSFLDIGWHKTYTRRVVFEGNGAAAYLLERDAQRQGMDGEAREITRGEMLIWQWH